MWDGKVRDLLIITTPREKCGRKMAPPYTHMHISQKSYQGMVAFIEQHGLHRDKFHVKASLRRIYLQACLKHCSYTT